MPVFRHARTAFLVLHYRQRPWPATSIKDVNEDALRDLLGNGNETIPSQFHVKQIAYTPILDLFGVFFARI